MNRKAQYILFISLLLIAQRSYGFLSSKIIEKLIGHVQLVKDPQLITSNGKLLTSLNLANDCAGRTFNMMKIADERSAKFEKYLRTAKAIKTIAMVHQISSRLAQHFQQCRDIKYMLAMYK
ncbi:MAG: hypothetical protein AAF706_02945, partial [Bacteroidota bacterium]